MPTVKLLFKYLAPTFLALSRETCPVTSLRKLFLAALSYHLRTLSYAPYSYYLGQRASWPTLWDSSTG